VTLEFLRECLGELLLLFVRQLESGGDFNINSALQISPVRVKER